MKTGLRMKLDQNKDVLDVLLSTENAHLVEDSPTDYYWGGAVEGSKNKLGELLMELRDEYQTKLKQNKSNF